LAPRLGAGQKGDPTPHQIETGAQYDGAANGGNASLCVVAFPTPHFSCPHMSAASVFCKVDSRARVLTSSSVSKSLAHQTTGSQPHHASLSESSQLDSFGVREVLAFRIIIFDSRSNLPDDVQGERESSRKSIKPLAAAGSPEQHCGGVDV
jgi:hypothetical protein